MPRERAIKESFLLAFRSALIAIMRILLPLFNCRLPQINFQRYSKRFFFKSFGTAGFLFPADSCSLKRIPFSGKSILVHPRVQWKNPLQRHLSPYIRDFISGIRNRENEASFSSRVSTGVRTRTLLMHERDTVGMCSRMWCFGQLQSSKIGRKRNASPSRQPCIGFSHKKVCAKAWN